MTWSRFTCPEAGHLRVITVILAAVMALSSTATAVATTDADASPTAVVGPEALFTRTRLISGGLDDCATPDAASCSGGLAFAAAHRRDIAARGTKAVFFGGLDWTSVFPKMHPLDWGVNFDLQPALGVDAMLTSTPLANKLYPAPYQAHPDAAPLLDNIDLPLEHALRALVVPQIIHGATRTHFIVARVLHLGLAGAARMVGGAMYGAREMAAAAARHTVVVTYDPDPAALLAAVMTVPLDNDERDRAAPTVVARYGGGPGPALVNGTWLVHLGVSSSALTRLRLHEDAAGRVANVSVVQQPLALSAAQRASAAYVADHARVAGQIALAKGANFVVGRTLGAMPGPSTGAAVTRCLAGECAMGNLWADAMRWRVGAECAVFPSAWLRGGGWAAGNVTKRDLYDAYSFTDSVAVMNITGLSIHELLNHSMAVSAFDGDAAPTSQPSRVLGQVSNMRVVYDKRRADPSRRLVSVAIYDAAAAAYLPLERHRVYRMASNAFMALSLVGVKEHLAKKYVGETGPLRTKYAMHDAVAAYLAAEGAALTPGVGQRLRDDATAAGDMVAWRQTAASCAVDTEFVAERGTCLPCAAGTRNAAPSAAGARCVAVPPPPGMSAGLRFGLIAGGVGAALALLVAAYVGSVAWRRHRRIRYCPKDAAAPVAAFFVTVRNEVAVRERHPGTAAAAFAAVERIVVEAAPRHGCYVARRLDAHFLVVTADPEAALRCVSDISRLLSAVEWRAVLPSAAAHHHVSARAVGRKRSGAMSGTARSVRQQPTSETGSSSSASSQVHSSPARKSAAGMSGSGLKSPVTSEPRKGKYAGRAAPAIVPPQVSIGVSYGTCRIDFDEEVVFYAYSGPVVDGAAAVADVARPGQVLVTEQCVDAAKARGVDMGPSSLGCDLEDFCATHLMCPLAHKTADVLLLQANPLGCEARTFEALSHSDDDDVRAAGVLAAALETAAGGLTSRRVGAVCWAVPALRSPGVFGSRAEHARHCEAVLAALQEVAHDARCDLVAALDGVFVAVVNGAAARTAQVATMAAGLGRAGIEAVEEATEHRVAAGVAVGTALAGAVADTVVVAGVTAERAQLLAAAAGHAEQPAVLVGEELFAELDPHFVLAAADVIAWPRHCQTERHTRAVMKSPSGRSSVASPTTASPHRAIAVRPPKHRGALLVYSVEAEKAAASDNEEWLYQFQAVTAGNPFAAPNALLQSALLHTKTASPSAAATPKEQSPKVGGLVPASPSGEASPAAVASGCQTPQPCARLPTLSPVDASPRGPFPADVSPQADTVPCDATTAAGRGNPTTPLGPPCERGSPRSLQSADPEAAEAVRHRQQWVESLCRQMASTHAHPDRTVDRSEAFAQRRTLELVFSFTAPAGSHPLSPADKGAF